MTYHPMSFSPEMARAILAGEKTQTRRFVTEANENLEEEVLGFPDVGPIWVPGDRLWVKKVPRLILGVKVPPIILEVEDVRKELLHEITEADAKAEGVDSVDEFRDLWNKLNAEHNWGLGWDHNPAVWVIKFRVLDGAELRKARKELVG